METARPEVGARRALPQTEGQVFARRPFRLAATNKDSAVIGVVPFLHPRHVGCDEALARFRYRRGDRLTIAIAVRAHDYAWSQELLGQLEEQRISDRGCRARHDDITAL